MSGTNIVIGGEGGGGGGGGAVDSVNGKTGVVVINKSDVGLSNVDNTSDVNKPISTATQTALNGKANSTHTHASNQITYDDTLTNWGASDVQEAFSAVDGLLGDKVNTVDLSLVAFDNDYESLDNLPDLSQYANISHTHSLNDLLQSGASIGQVATWNGSAWAPETFSGSVPTIANRQLYYQNDLGAMDGINGFFVNSYGGLNKNIGYDSSDNDYFAVNETFVGVDTTLNAPNSVAVLSSNTLNVGFAGSGFDFGTNGIAGTVQYNSIETGSTSDLGGFELIKNYFYMGDSGSVINIKGFSFIFGFGDVENNVNINGPMQGYGYQPTFEAGATVDPTVAYTQAFYDAITSVDTVFGYHTSFRSTPQLYAVGNTYNVSAFESHMQIENLFGNASVSSISIYDELGTFDTGSYNGISINPTIDLVNSVNGIYIDMRNVTVPAGTSPFAVLGDLTFSLINPAASGPFVQFIAGGTAGSESVNFNFGTNTLEITIEDGVSTAQQIKDAADSVPGLSANISVVIAPGQNSVTQTTQGPTQMLGGSNPGYKVAIGTYGNVNINGDLRVTGSFEQSKIQASSEQNIIEGDGSGSPNIVNILNSELNGLANISIANGDTAAILSNLQINLGVNSDINNGGFNLGLSNFVAPTNINMAAGSLVDFINGIVSVLNVDSGDGTATIDRFNGFRAEGINPTALIINEYVAYEFNQALPTGTDVWGINMVPAYAENYIGGSLNIGGSTRKVSNSSVALEILHTDRALLLSRHDSTELSGLTPLAGMVVFNTTTNKFQGYDGTSWVDLN